MLAIEPNIPASRICAVTQMNKAAVSKSFKKLQAKGLIDFTTPPDKPRRKQAYLTEKGLQLHDQIITLALQREQALLSNIDDEDINKLFEILDKMVCNFEKL